MTWFLAQKKIMGRITSLYWTQIWFYHPATWTPLDCSHHKHFWTMKSLRNPTMGFTCQNYDKLVANFGFLQWHELFYTKRSIFFEVKKHFWLTFGARTILVLVLRCIHHNSGEYEYHGTFRAVSNINKHILLLGPFQGIKMTKTPGFRLLLYF